MTKRFTWPWGRLSPEKRLSEINTMIERNEARIKIIEMQAKEAVRLQTKNIEALRQQKKMVESFLEESERKQLLEEAFELETSGVSVLDKISEASSIEEIEKIIQLAKEESARKNLEDDSSGTNFEDSSNVLDIFEDLGDEVDDIFGTQE